MTVTRIEPYHAKQVKVYLDGEFAFVLYKGELSRYHIADGAELDSATYRMLTEEILVKRVRLRAMNLLTKRPYTEQGLRKKLREGMYPKWLEDNAVEYVKSYGYINDETYAMDYAMSMSGRYSLRMLRQKMREKGISEEVMESCLADMEEELLKGDEELLHTLIMKKTAGKGVPDDPSSRAKLMRFLAGKGFSSDMIQRAIRSEKQAESET